MLNALNICVALGEKPFGYVEDDYRKTLTFAIHNKKEKVLPTNLVSLIVHWIIFQKSDRQNHQNSDSF